MVNTGRLQEFLYFIVQSQDQGTSGSTEHIRQSALEHGRHTLILDNLDGAVPGVLVQNLLAT
jgi:hypothetical protein